jgi:hypothetical protein
MRKFALALLAMGVLATGAFAQQPCPTATSIHTLQMNSPVGVNTLVTPCDVVVTAVTTTGFYVSQPPHGAWDAIWIYNPGHSFVPGDVVSICGVFKEVCGLSTIDIPGAGIYGYVLDLNLGHGGPVPPVNYITAAALMASPEQWESVSIMITDGMNVPAGFNLGSGRWAVNAVDGTHLFFDDFWYPFATVAEGQCYNNATGLLHQDCDGYWFEPFLGGIALTNCSVDAKPVSMGTLKALYR